MTRNSPRCVGSGSAVYLTGIKAALCIHCGNTVAVKGGKLAEHWWPHNRFTRMKGGKHGKKQRPQND